jgi:hypothetical protein
MAVTAIMKLRVEFALAGTRCVRPALLGPALVVDSHKTLNGFGEFAESG